MPTINKYTEEQIFQFLKDMARFKDHVYRVARKSYFMAEGHLFEEGIGPEFKSCWISDYIIEESYNQVVALIEVHEGRQRYTKVVRFPLERLWSLPVVNCVLALDLEGTLVDNVYDANPRPGLFNFLEFCVQSFPAVVFFTAAEKEAIPSCISKLREDGHLPAGYDSVGFVPWAVNSCKDLEFVQQVYPELGIDDIWLLDDDEYWINPEERHRWIPIDAFGNNIDFEYDLDNDTELERVQGVLMSFLAEIY